MEDSEDARSMREDKTKPKPIVSARRKELMVLADGIVERIETRSEQHERHLLLRMIDLMLRGLRGDD